MNKVTTIQVKGEKGEQGNDGHCPELYADYFTEEDKRNINEYIIQSIWNNKDGE